MEFKIIEEMIRQKYCLRDCDNVEIKYNLTVHDTEKYLVEDTINYNGKEVIRKTLVTITTNPNII